MSRDTLAEYQDIIREYIGGKHGIYALYKKDRLYFWQFQKSPGNWVRLGEIR